MPSAPTFAKIGRIGRIINVFAGFLSSLENTLRDKRILNFVFVIVDAVFNFLSSIRRAHPASLL